MVDVFTAEKRSEVMSLIRSRGNKSTELRMVILLKAYAIKGWRRHVKLPGRPDFAFRKHRLVLFVDGDFWHGNPKAYRPPKSNIEYWSNKVASNKKRDRRVTRELKTLGWSVMRVWESDLAKHPEQIAKRIFHRLKSQTIVQASSGNREGLASFCGFSD
jgi:DNA mismatch endonuclease (patch repair protein)